MIELSLIRHAKTDSNHKHIFMGTLDIPCSEQGLEEARIAVKNINYPEYDKYYCSPLLRAKQTADILFPYKNMLYDSRLRERGLGIWEGIDKHSVERNFPEAFINGSLKFQCKPQEGEPYTDSIRRALSFLEEIVQYPDGYRIVALSHNGILRIIIGLLTQTDLELVFHNSIEHLSPQIFLIEKSEIFLIRKFSREQICKKW